jgi:hypothetical protein
MNVQPVKYFIEDELRNSHIRHAGSRFSSLQAGDKVREAVKISKLFDTPVLFFARAAFAKHRSKKQEQKTRNSYKEESSIHVFTLKKSPNRQSGKQ